MVSIVKKGKDRYSQREFVRVHKEMYKYNKEAYCKHEINGMIGVSAGHKMFARLIRKKLRKEKPVCILTELGMI